ncbi:hypothetical protein NL676_039527 [Syzygium grande]|nr:hypothetical protein NL676_039527 [Syzygium grande]
MSATTLETSAMVSHSTSERGTRGRGYRGRGRGFLSIRGHGGRDGVFGGRGSHYCNHCQKNGHTEAYCYTIYPELRPTVATYVDSPALTSSEPPLAYGTGDTMTLS